LLASSLLYSKYLNIQGVWNGGGREIYTKGNQQYCLKTTAGSSIRLKLTNNTVTPIYSTIYLTQGSIVGQARWINPYISVNNLNSKLYKIVIAPDTPQFNVDYNLTAYYYSGTFGRCTDYYQSGYLGMSIEQVNFILALSGLFTAIGFFGSITYVILTLGNF